MFIGETNVDVQHLQISITHSTVIVEKTMQENDLTVVQQKVEESNEETIKIGKCIRRFFYLHSSCTKIQLRLW